LTQDLGRFEKAVNSLGVNLNQQQFDALVSFAFNVRNFGTSTLFSNVASGTAVTKENFTAYGHARKDGKLIEVPSLMKGAEANTTCMLTASMTVATERGKL
jgi:GH24 family phage-related lysozyme (muramidase)